MKGGTHLDLAFSNTLPDGRASAPTIETNRHEDGASVLKTASIEGKLATDRFLQRGTCVNS